MTLARPLAPSSIRISCLPNAETFAVEHRANIVVSLLDMRMRAPQFEHVPSLLRHYAFYFRDQESVEPDGLRDAVSDLISIAERARTSKMETRILVHCHGGVSRSTASAYILLAGMFPERTAEGLFRDLLTIARKPWPNRLMVEIAEKEFEKRLDRKVQLVCPLDRYREMHPRRLEAYRKVNVKRGIVSGDYKR